MFDQRSDDEMFELMASWDYKREAYGDPCPGCGRLCGGGDCGYCFSEEEEPSEPIQLDLPFIYDLFPVNVVPDDIPF